LIRIFWSASATYHGHFLGDRPRVGRHLAPHSRGVMTALAIAR
jgi:hypothetical protein